MLVAPACPILLLVLLVLESVDRAWACGSHHPGHAPNHEGATGLNRQNLRDLRRRGVGKPKRIIECGTPTPNRTEVRSNMAAVADFYRQADSDEGLRRRLQAGPIVIDINFVVVTEPYIGIDGVPYEYGDVSQERLDLQIGVLNAAFSPEFSFQLASVQRVSNESYFTVHPGWPGESSREELELKAQYRRGGTETLNVYSLEPDGGDLTSTLLGFAYPPYPYVNRRVEDGIFIHHETLPDGAFREGKVSLDWRQVLVFTSIFCHLIYPIVHFRRLFMKSATGLAWRTRSKGVAHFLVTEFLTLLPKQPPQADVIWNLIPVLVTISLIQ
jgi:hypothetical protein